MFISATEETEIYLPAKLLLFSQVGESRSLDGCVSCASEAGQLHGLISVIGLLDAHLFSCKFEVFVV